MKNLFGSSGLINPLTLIVCGCGCLLNFILRKAINDTMDMPFSIIGSTAGLALGYIIFDNLFGMKWGILAGIIALAAAGLGVGNLLNDGEASS